MNRGFTFILPWLGICREWRCPELGLSGLNYRQPAWLIVALTTPRGAALSAEPRAALGAPTGAGMALNIQVPRRAVADCHTYREVVLALATSFVGWSATCHPRLSRENDARVGAWTSCLGRFWFGGLLYGGAKALGEAGARVTTRSIA